MVDKLWNNLVTMDNVYDSWMDDPWVNMRKEIFGWMDSISMAMFDQGDCLTVLENYKNLSFEEMKKDGLPECINVYPNDRNERKLDQVYTQFLGICSGKCTLKTVLMASHKYLNAYIQRYMKAYIRKDTVPLPDIPIITILTDKWDSNMTRDYEIGWIADKFNYGLLVNVFLVTRYGMTKVVLLNEDSCKKACERIEMI